MRFKKMKLEKMIGVAKRNMALKLNFSISMPATSGKKADSCRSGGPTNQNGL